MPKNVFTANTTIESAKVNQNFDGAYDGSFDTTHNSLQSFRDEAFADFVISGGVITDPGASLSQTTTSIVVVIDGYRIEIAATAKTYTASKDTYVDILRSGSTGSYVYTEVANGAAAPALASNSIRIAKVVTNGTEITSSTQVGSDSLGNLIYPKNVTEGGFGAWRAWNPTLTNLTIGNGTTVAEYMQIGKTVHFRIKITLGSTSSVGTGPAFTLPVNATSDYAANDTIGVSILRDATGSDYNAMPFLNSTTVCRITYWAVSGANIIAADITSTAPFTWATSDRLLAYGFYEAA